MSNASPLTQYSMQFSFEIKATRRKVWQALTRSITKWWPTSFFSQPHAKAFVMECKVGGRIYEDWGRKSGGEWGRLIAFQPEERLVWAGHHFGSNGKNWGNFFVTILLKDNHSTTVLEFEDTGFGLIDQAMPASLESGWKELLGQHFKTYVEAKAARRKKK